MLDRLILLSLFLGYAKGDTLWSWSHESQYKQVRSVLKDSFDYTNTKGQFGISSDSSPDSLSLAPSPSNDGTYVLRVYYKRGTYASKCSNGNGCYRGAQFYVQPSALSNQMYTTLILEYEIWFNSNFQWNKGGKLPGLWGGTRDCSGGRISDTCFSTRLMWRREGEGEVYAYVTHDQEPSWDQFCDTNGGNTEKHKHIHCTSSWGIQIGTGSFNFTRGQWHKIRQEVHLNSSPTQPGYITLWVDDSAKIYDTNIVMRNNNDFGIDGIFFSTFYGGGDKSWKCPRSTSTYYRNFRLSTDTATPALFKQ